MNLDAILPGKDFPHDINVFIEISLGSSIKYELDKASGALFVDRFLYTSMTYPGNYGFIPHTLSKDGDPCDVILFNDTPLMPGCVIKCRPIGVLFMEDEAGFDEKIIAVPCQKITKLYDTIEECSHLPSIFLDKVKHFFERYKDLEPNKWVKVTRWGNAQEAKDIILQSLVQKK